MGKRKNLHMYLESWVHKLNFNAGATAITEVCIRNKDGAEFVLKATHEVLLCAGAVDTPRLLLLSGIGPKKDLEELGIVCKRNLKGVGENLVDHPVRLCAALSGHATDYLDHRSPSSCVGCFL